MSNITETITIKIDVLKIDKDRLFTGKSGKYLDATLVMRDEPDQYGNIGFITQSITKEERDSGKKAPIIGNVSARYVKGTSTPPKPATRPAPADDDDQLPF